MTTPLDAWNQLFRIDEACLPYDDEQLEVICSTADNRTVSHIGIQYGNCFYNSEAITNLRRKYAHDGKLTLDIRANDCAAHIWVRDPGSRAWIEVINQDPDTVDLTFAQVGLLEKLRRIESTPDRKISRAAARQRMRELVERAQSAKTIRGLPRLLKLLGVDSPADRSGITDRHLQRIGAPRAPIEPTKSDQARPSRASRKQTEVQPAADQPLSRRAPTGTNALPIYKVVGGGSDDVR